DTLMQSAFKEELIQTFLENLSSKEKENLQNQFDIDITKTLLSKSNENAYVFIRSKVVLYFLDTPFTHLLNGDTSFNMDYSKIDLLPQIALKKNKNDFNSSEIGNYLSNADTAKKFVLLLQNFYVNLFKESRPYISIDNTLSKFYLLSQEFPVIKIKIDYSYENNNLMNKASLQLYYIYKHSYTYLISFSYKIEDSDLWQAYIKKFMEQIVIE
ncbi:MAG: hypothetical protein WBO44_00455, partial [Saprospiraceae bacterium]